MTISAFATKEQYAAIYGTSTTDAALQKATRLMIAKMNPYGIDWQNPDELFSGILSDVCCSVTHRADESVANAEIPFGASQFSQSASPYSVSATLANPYGDMFLTKAEKEQLGIGGTMAMYSYPGGIDVQD